jgi:2,3-diphosphopglycerate-independent phosphoglycerate mutase
VELRELVNDRPAHLVLLVVDGLGGYADAEHGSELEEARTPNLDRLANEGSCGLASPAGPGITVGSGPGHLALFGYDPLEYDLGRGLLSALGLGLELRTGDLAARGNLATLDAEGRVTDRRAGRIDDERARAIVEHLGSEVALPDVEVSFRHVSEHRVLLHLRGEGLDPRIGDLDPQRTGVPPLEPTAEGPEAERTARCSRSSTWRSATRSPAGRRRRALARVRHPPRAAEHAGAVRAPAQPPLRPTPCTGVSPGSWGWTRCPSWARSPSRSR